MKITTVHKNIIDSLANIAAEEIQKEIDFEILSELLVKCGWTRVVLPPFDVRYHADDIRIWAEANCGRHAEFKQYGSTYIFKDSKDATAFALKWL